MLYDKKLSFLDNENEMNSLIVVKIIQYEFALYNKNQKHLLKAFLIQR